MTARILVGDCLDAMAGMEAESVDAIVTDPPYGLRFMEKDWDHGVPGEPFWREALRVAKPGAHLLAFGGTRTFHRLAVAIEDAGWQIRDTIMWVYGSGFPKSLDLSKAIDKMAGAEREVTGSRIGDIGIQGGNFANKSQQGVIILRDTPATDAARQWLGWGTALKPACEPIIVARKPLCGTVAENVLRYGTGGINVDACKVGTETVGWGGRAWGSGAWGGQTGLENHGESRPVQGRFPANLIHDGSDEVLAGFPETNPTHVNGHEDLGGSAARFFYCAKASKTDRDEGLGEFDWVPRQTLNFGFGPPSDQLAPNNRNIHPTVKPTALMRYLCRLVTPPGGLVFDPFMGSGSTGKAAVLEGFRFVGCELNQEYAAIARARIAHAEKSRSQQLDLFG